MAKRRKLAVVPEETVMRGVIKFLLSLIVGIAIIWIGFWWYAEHRLQSGFQAWAEQQATAGWKISFDSAQRGTSPINALLTVNHLTLTPPPGPDGEVITITLPSVALRIAALDPLVFHTDLPNEIAITVGNNIGLVINTGSIAFSENLDPDTLFKHNAYPVRGFDFSADNIQILASSLQVLQIDHIASHGDINLTAGANATAISSTTTLDGLALSPLLTRLGSVPFDGKLTHFSQFGALSGPLPDNLAILIDQIGTDAHDREAQRKLLIPVLRRWAVQGGHGNMTFNVILGPSTIKGGESIGFDANLQPDFIGDLYADRLGAFTTALTNAYPVLQNGIAEVEAKLSPYITNTQQGGQTLQMHVAYGPKIVTINGQKVSDLPPVDWNALENPPPAPPPQPPIPVPGDGSGAALPAPVSP